MRRLLRKVRVVSALHSRKRARRKTFEQNQESFLKAAKMMEHEYPMGTSHHYIAYQLQRNRAI